MKRIIGMPPRTMKKHKPEMGCEPCEPQGPWNAMNNHEPVVAWRQKTRKPKNKSLTIWFRSRSPRGPEKYEPVMASKYEPQKAEIYEPEMASKNEPQKAAWNGFEAGAPEGRKNMSL